MKDWFKAEVQTYTQTQVITTEEITLYIDEVILAGQDEVCGDLRKKIIEGLEAFIGATLCRVNRVPMA